MTSEPSRRARNGRIGIGAAVAIVATCAALAGLAFTWVKGTRVETERTDGVPRATAASAELVSDVPVAVREPAASSAPDADEVQSVARESRVTRVRGSLGAEAGARMHPASRVELIDFRSEHATGDWRTAGPVRERSLEGLENDTFLIEGVRPGAKQLVAVWSTRPGVFEWSRIGFELAEGEDRDLGRIVAEPGPPLRVFTALRDLEDIDVPVADLFGPRDPPTARLVLELDTGRLTASGLRPSSIHLQVPLVGALELRGLVGQSLSASLDTSLIELPRSDLDLLGDGTDPLEPPFPAQIELVARVRPMADYVLRIRALDGGPLPQLQVAEHVPGCWTSHGGASPDRDDPRSAVYEVRATTGSCFVSMSSWNSLGTTTGSEWSWTGVLTPDLGPHVDVELVRAASVTGSVRTQRPSSLLEFVQLCPIAWTDHVQDHWPFSAWVGHGGRFELHGLPPHTEFRIHRSQQRVTTAASGSAVQIELELE